MLGRSERSTMFTERSSSSKSDQGLHPEAGVRSKPPPTRLLSDEGNTASGFADEGGAQVLVALESSQRLSPPGGVLHNQRKHHKAKTHALTLTSKADKRG